MNTSKTDLTRRDASADKSLKKKKNIRQIYLESVQNNRGTKGKIRNKNITNIGNFESSAGSSNYLESEYNLVKNILNSTRALEKLRTQNDFKNENSLSGTTARVANTPRYKTQEEYYQEILDLKKTLKYLENNEVIYKAKLEYFENELDKKEQEIIKLLDSKRNEESRAISDSKSDLEAINLKLKAFKLEYSLKRKDAELNKLKNELKTTDFKELKLQNERLKEELSNVLVQNRKMIEAQELKEMILKDGVLTYAIDKNKNVSIIENNDTPNQQTATKIKSIPSFNKLEDSTKLDKDKPNNNINNKVSEREEVLLRKIEQLEKELSGLKKKPSTSTGGSDSESRSPSRPSSKNEKFNAIEILQSVFKGHLERRKIIKEFHREKEYENEIVIQKPEISNKPVKRPSRSRSRSPPTAKLVEIYNPRPKEVFERPERQTKNPNPRPSREIVPSSSSDEDENKNAESVDDPKKKLIPIKEEPKKKKVIQTDTSCCTSPWSKC